MESKMLEVQEVHTYYGRSHILQGLSLSVGEGEVVCLLGRNGAGKTTTLRSIIGLTPPSWGSIKLMGVEIRGKRPFEICRMGVGYVPQDRRIFPDLTIDENLEVVEHSTQDRWMRERFYEIFADLKRLKGNKGRNLSGGEQSMLALARALMVNPKLLLLDEPTAGLSPKVVKTIGRLITAIAKTGLSILIAEQNVKFVLELASRGYIIDKGRILREGPIENLFKSEVTILTS